MLPSACILATASLITAAASFGIQAEPKMSFRWTRSGSSTETPEACKGKVRHLPDDVGDDAHVVFLVDLPHGLFKRGVVRIRSDVNAVQPLAGGPQVFEGSVQPFLHSRQENQQNRFEVDLDIQPFDLHLGDFNIELLRR